MTLFGELVYSIDKIKLFINGVKLPVVQFLLNKLQNYIGVDLTFYESNAVAKCRYNFVFKNGDKTLYLGIEPNWSKCTNKSYRDIVIEYNPNKVELSDYELLRSIFPIDDKKTEVMSMDVAIDIFDYHIGELIVYKRHGNEYKCSLEHSNIETIYLGAFGTNGHIKIYDKAKEQKIKNFKWTRYEITYKKLGFLDFRDTKAITETELANIKLIDKDIDISELSGTEKYLLLSSMDNLELLKLLDKRMRKRILEYHDKYLTNLNITKESILEVYKNFIII